MPVMLNPFGEIGNFVNASQFVGGHSEFACGPFAVSHLRYSTAPYIPNTYTPIDLQEWAFQQYIQWIGPDAPSDTQGSSINNVHRFIKDASLHWYDMPVSATTSHGDDIARIKAALSYGYPVIATVTEISIFDVKLNRNPYWWGPSGTHIIVYSGVKGINFLCQDTANIVGALQGANWVQPGPREYLAATIDNSWASIVQTPWLQPIPNGDPLTWKKDFQAQIAKNDPLDKWLLDTWNNSVVTTLKGKPLPISTGIAAAWRMKAHDGHFFGPPISGEYDSVDNDGNKITIQDFARGQANWHNGQCTFV